MNQRSMFAGKFLLGAICVSSCLASFLLSFNPFDLSLRLTPYDHKRTVQVGLVCLLTALFCFNGYRSVLSEVLRDKKPLLLWALSLVLVFISSVLADNSIHSLFESLHWLLLLSVLCCGFFLARSHLATMILAGLLILHTLMVLKALLFLVFEVSVGGSLRAALLYPGVEHHRFFNQIQVFIIPLLYMWAVRTRFRAFGYFFLFANLLLAFCGGARGLLVGLFAGGLLAFFLLKPWRTELRWGALISLLALGCYLIISVSINMGANADVLRAHTSGRLDIWLRLISALEFSHVYLGEGSGAFSYHSFDRLEGHPHNSLLQFVYEWGVLSTLAMLAALLWILERARRWLLENQGRLPCQDLVAALLVAITSGAAYSLFSGIVVMPIPQTLLFLLIGLLWGLVLLKPEDASPLNNVYFGCLPFRYIFRSVAIGAIVALTLTSYVHLGGAYLIQQAGFQEGFRAPRFWANGAPLINR